jgi:3-oxoacid CoA-transferase subunit A
MEIWFISIGIERIMSVYITGDTHGCIGDYRLAYSKIENPTEDDVIIVCGDNGIFYGEMVQGQCRKFMKKTPVTWILLRGNHDNRLLNAEGSLNSGWHYNYSFGGVTYIQDKYPNIHYIADTGGIYNIKGINFLMIPGGYSVDKKWRYIHHLPYEPRELLTEEEMSQLWDSAFPRINEIDYVCSHVAPKLMEPYFSDLFMSNMDQSQIDKSMEEWLDDVVPYIEEYGENYKHCYFGHYHADRPNFGPNNNYTMLYDNVVKIK